MRARNIKPGFFENEKLSELDPIARILFAGLWCYADREGRFEWRLKRIKALILPYDDVDITSTIHALTLSGFVIKYKKDDISYGYLPNFKKHQNPHCHEAQSKIPEYNQCLCEHSECTVHVSEKPEVARLIPDSGSLIADSGSLIAPKTENPLSATADPVAQKLKNLKISKEAVQEKIKIEYQKALPFLKEKYPGRDYDLELRTMLDWAVRKISVARKRVEGDLVLFFENWMRKARAAKPWEVAAEQAEKPVDWICKKCGKKAGTLFPGGLCRICYES